MSQSVPQEVEVMLRTEAERDIRDYVQRRLNLLGSQTGRQVQALHLSVSAGRRLVIEDVSVVLCN
jgi:hypothetical protein